MKRLVALLLVCVVVLSGMYAGAVEYGVEYKDKPTNTYSQKFPDVPKNHWAFSYIGEMSARGVINGYPDGKFRPEDSVERAEFAKIMVGAAGLNVVNRGVSSFADVDPDEWYAPYIECAKNYLTGYQSQNKKLYQPEKDALREDITVALVKLKGYDVSVADESILDMFSDKESISKSLRKYVAVAVERGLVSGYEDGTFRGQDTIARAEAATMLWRAFQYGNDNKTVASDMKGNTKYTAEEKNDTKVENKNETKKDNVPDVNIVIDTEDEEKLPYVMDKLASAKVIEASWSGMTMDENDNIYYLDQDGKVYVINTESGKKSKFFDADKLSEEQTEEKEVETVEEVTETVETGEYEEVVEEVEEVVTDEETGEETTVIKKEVTRVPVMEEVTKEVVTTVTEDVIVAEYSNYIPVQVFYDYVNDRILLSGYYKNIERAFENPETDGHYNVVYDITDGDAELLAENCGFDWRKNYNLNFYGAHNNNSYIVENDGVYYEWNMETDNWRYISSNCGIMMKYGNSIYSLNYGINKYNFNSGEFESISERISFDGFGSKDDCFYFRNDDGSMFKISVKTGKTEGIDVNFNENVDFADMGGMNDVWQRFFIIDDDTFVFYDKAMGAFRKVSKNR